MLNILLKLLLPVMCFMLLVWPVWHLRNKKILSNKVFHRSLFIFLTGLVAYYSTNWNNICDSFKKPTITVSEVASLPAINQKTKDSPGTVQVMVNNVKGNISIDNSRDFASIASTNKQIAKIHFEQSRLFINRAIWGNDQIPVYFFKVQIFNESEHSTIRAKYLKLTDLRKLDNQGVFVPWENAVPAVLEWPIDIDKDISPKENVFVPFARIFPPEIQKMRDTLLSGDIEVPQIRFTVAMWDRQMTSHIPIGTHRFKITAFFENNPPAEAGFQLEWSGERRENIDSMVNDIKITQIN